MAQTRIGYQLAGGLRLALKILWFALVGRNRLVLAPEEAFAIEASEPG